jgi:general secretion pathway protein D
LKVALLAFAVLLSACQGTDSTSRTATGARQSTSQGGEHTNQPLAQQALGPDPGKEALSGQTAEEAPRQASGLLQPEYYPGTGALVRSTGSATAEAPVSDDGHVSLNFASADIREVIDVVLGDTLNLNYIIDPRVQGTVLARTSEPLKREDVIPALENILALNGAALKLVDGLYHVIPLREASRKLGLPQSALTARQRAHGFTITVIPLRYTSAAAFHQMAASLIPPDRVFLPDPSRNLLIFAGTGTEANDLLEFVRLFDVNWMSGMSYALFPATVADVTVLTSELEQLFLDERTGRLQDLIRFIPIKRMNAILVISPQQAYIEDAGRWIERLDRGETSTARRIYVYYVQNSRSADLAEILSQVFEQSNVESTPGLTDVIAPGLTPVSLSSSATGVSVLTTADAAEPETEAGPEASTRSYGSGGPATDTGASSIVGALVSESGNVRIIADERNNALVILATPSEYRMIEATLHRLDLVPLQVLIEATIAEVTLVDELKYGLQWFFTQGDFAATFSDLNSGLVSSAFPGFSAVFDSNDARVILNALTAVTDIEVISSPQLMVLNNQSALLNVGDSVPITTQTSQQTTGDAAIVNSVEYRDTGVILEITPRVNTSGLVVLDIIQEVSDAVETETSSIDSPTITVRRVESIVAVHSGETVALGGLIRDRRTDEVTGIPLLSDIPILGNLFKTTGEEVRRTELLILITPWVVRNLEDARAVTKELRQRLTGFDELEQRIRRITPPKDISRSEELQSPEKATSAKVQESVDLLEPNDSPPPDEFNTNGTPDPESLPEADKSTGVETVGTTETPEHSLFAIHLSSHKSKDAATAEWSQLQAKYPHLLGQKRLALQTVDLEGRGTFVHVLAESFDDRAGAQDLCTKLSPDRQYCSVVERPGIDGMGP